MLASKDDGFLDVIRRSRVDANYWHAPSLTRNAKRGVEVAALDRAVGEGVRLPVGDFRGPGLIRAPDVIVPAREDISTVARSRVIAWSGWWERVDQRLGDF